MRLSYGRLVGLYCIYSKILEFSAVFWRSWRSWIELAMDIDALVARLGSDRKGWLPNP